MKNTNKIIAGVVAFVLLLVINVFLVKDSVKQEFARVQFPSNEGYGAAVSPNTHSFFNAGFTSGGVVATTTTAATYTTVAKDFAGTPTVWSINAGLNTTISLSGTSTHAYIPNVGDVANIYVRSATTTAATTITFAAEDIGVDLQMAEATGGDLVLEGLDWAKVTFIRTSANLVTIIFDEMKEAD